MSRARSTEAELGSVIGGTLLIVGILTFVPAYGLYRVLRMVVRTYWRYPHHRALWYTLAAWLGSGLLALGIGSLVAVGTTLDSSVVVLVAVLPLTLTTLAMPLTALVVLHYEQQQDAHRAHVETSLTDVLPNPWWPPAQ